MPLTFAHPAIVLPFVRNSRYVNVVAMVLGTMAPDFEYFLNGRPHGAFGHTYSGFFLLNLPLVCIVYIVYRVYVQQVLIVHLPHAVQFQHMSSKSNNKLLNSIVFMYSALFGMLTHVTWDAFTHANGFVVRHIPFFSKTLAIFGRELAIFKLLQHGSTIFGLTCIALFVLIRARKNQEKSSVSSRQKWLYWGLIVFWAIVLFSVWHLIEAVSLQAYGVIVVRIIDSSFVSLLVVSMYFNYRKKIAGAR